MIVPVVSRKAKVKWTPITAQQVKLLSKWVIPSNGRLMDPPAEACAASIGGGRLAVVGHLGEKLGCWTRRLLSYLIVVNGEPTAVCRFLCIHSCPINLLFNGMFISRSTITLTPWLFWHQRYT